MFKNYLTIALRNIKRYKGYSFLNVIGLAIGMAVCTLILLWVQDELSWDRFHKNNDHIFRVISEDRSGGNLIRSVGSPSLIGPTLVEEYPEVENFTRVQSGWSNWYLHLGDKIFITEKLACADPSFFEIFQFPFLKGDPKTALHDRYSIVLTERLAKKIFGDDEPMGKIVQMSDTDLKVTGVMKDIPHNSHLQFDYIFPVINMTEWRESKLDSWTYTQFTTYILTKKNIDLNDLKQKMAGMVIKNIPDSKITLDLQPLKSVHLHSMHLNSWNIVYPNPGNITYIYIFSIVAILILALACINFTNLSTARSGARAKEIGIRKVTGAQRRDIIIQFLGETLLLSFLALFVSIILVEILLPTFNSLASKQLSLDPTKNLSSLFVLLGIVILTGIVSGSYPALYLSSFQPAGVFRAMAQFSAGKGGALRKVLVVSQFSITITLIILTAVIYWQLHFIQNKDLGFDQNNIISFASYGQYGMNFEAAKNELLQNPNILSVSQAFPPGPGFGGTTQVQWEGKDPTREIMLFSDLGDYDFLKTFGLKMAAGRFYSREFISDDANFVLNESAIKRMDLNEPIGKRLTINGKTGTIIGVVKDYHGGSLRNFIQPKVISLRNGFFVCVKYSGSEQGIVSYLEQKWKKFVPGHPFRYQFLDESIENLYTTERKIGKIFGYFSGLAIFIACLGLFGLASFMAGRRTKEIGIRKVLGAKVAGIVLLLSGEFTLWVLIANIISWPVAYWAASQWLQGFSYRINLGWEPFVLSAMVVLVISIFTVSYQAIKAAVTNPVESLHCE
ncbi:MAG: ABC transporter permease [Candidatus Zhuqueibacterota bacterium]